MKKWLSLGLALCSSSVFALKYDCTPPKYGTYEKTMLVEVVSGQSIKIDGHALSRDLKYRPRLNKSYLRFEGDTSFLTADSYAIDVLVNESMFFSEEKSSMKIIARGEGYFNDYFACFIRR